MPTLLDTESGTEILVQAVNDILIERGPAGLSLRRIAAISGVSTSSMLHHLGSREHLLRVAAGRTTRRRVAHLESTACSDGAVGFLPRNGDELLETRAWLARLELWRSEDFLARRISESRDHELALLARVTDYQLRRPDLDGLRVALCAPEKPMRTSAVRDILRSRVAS